MTTRYRELVDFQFSGAVCVRLAEQSSSRVYVGRGGSDRLELRDRVLRLRAEVLLSDDRLHLADVQRARLDGPGRGGGRSCCLACRFGRRKGEREGERERKGERERERERQRKKKRERR